MPDGFAELSGRIERAEDARGAERVTRRQGRSGFGRALSAFRLRRRQKQNHRSLGQSRNRRRLLDDGLFRVATTLGDKACSFGQALGLDWPSATLVSSNGRDGRPAACRLVRQSAALAPRSMCFSRRRCRDVQLSRPTQPGAAAALRPLLETSIAQAATELPRYSQLPEERAGANAAIGFAGRRDDASPPQALDECRQPPLADRQLSLGRREARAAARRQHRAARSTWQLADRLRLPPSAGAFVWPPVSPSPSACNLRRRQGCAAVLHVERRHRLGVAAVQILVVDDPAVTSAAALK